MYIKVKCSNISGSCSRTMTVWACAILFPLALLLYAGGLKKIYSYIMFPLFMPSLSEIIPWLVVCSSITSICFYIISFCSCSMLVCSYLMVPKQELPLLTALWGNGILYIMYITLCFMVIFSYSMALYSSIICAFSCTKSIYPKMIDLISCHCFVWVCIRVKCSNAYGGYSCTWLFKHYHDFTCFIKRICS